MPCYTESAIGTVATDDALIITVTATYNYQGQPASVQVSRLRSCGEMIRI
jgi:hypothetical protein